MTDEKLIKLEEKPKSSKAVDCFVQPDKNENVPEECFYTCPICNVTFTANKPSDLGSFNTHIDSCLNRETIGKILNEQKTALKYNCETKIKSNKRKNESKIKNGKKKTLKKINNHSIEKYFSK